jgi:TonB-linked SusC/RagA family outer membrane protein
VAVRNENWYNRSFYGQNITNPVEEMENGKSYKNSENRLVASGNALITFMKGLTFKSTFSLDRRHGVNTGFNQVIHVPGIDSWGSASDTRSQNTVLTFDNILTYNKTFGRHNIEALAGTSWTDSYWSQSYINGDHFRDNNIHTLNAANKISWDNTGSRASAWGIMSYLARAQYNYDGKYYLTANIRADGSSKIHPDYRWGYFPSFSAAWRISGENFMKNIDWLDDLKLRAGWGQTGNQSSLGDYGYLQLYSITRQVWWTEGQIDVLPIIQTSNIPTVDLRWEVVSQTNFGIDFMALNNRLTISADYYYKLTTDMLLSVEMGGSGNLREIRRNSGSMFNKGFELSVNSYNIKNDNVTWNTDLKFSLNRNKLLKLDLVKIYNAAETSDAFHGSQIVRNVEGRPLGNFFGYISDGVDPETGELMYRDLNGDKKITATDRTYIGDPNPDFIYGLTNTVTWKGFSLSIFIQGTYGNDIFNASRIETEGMNDLKNQSTRTVDRWRRPGMETQVPKANFDLRPSSYFIEDGSYLRIKDLTLSYNLSNDVLKKIGISRLQPYITAQNLLTITKYMGMDPEVNQWGNSNAVQGIDWGTYPQSKVFVFGINLEF